MWRNGILNARLAVVVLLCLPMCAMADIRLPRLISDGMVLQRDMPAALWGWADEGERVTVALDGRTVAETQAAAGRWQVALDPCAAGGPHVLTISGANQLTVSDVWCGDVWIASGQSNMELTMDRVRYTYADDMVRAADPLIRQFKVPRGYDFDAPHDDLDGGEWQVAAPETLADFSAVGYFFARALEREKGVPIGIVSSNYGGSPAEGWMSEAALADYPEYLQIAKRYRDKAYLKGLMDADRQDSERWNAQLDAADAGLRGDEHWSAASLDDSDWRSFDVPGLWANTAIGDINGSVWFRRTVELPAGSEALPAKLWLGRIVDADTVFVNGAKVGNTTYQYPPRRYLLPAGTLHGGRNLIAVRIVNSSGQGGFIDDKPYYLEVGDTHIDLTGTWRARRGATVPALAGPRFLDYKQPLGFYNAMLAPLFKLRIKGVIWYQGESNVGRADEYRRMFPAMIKDWRRHWRQGDVPFLFVQLANFLEARKQPVDSEWAALRDAQRAALALPNTAMAVTIDVGEWNDIHPKNKKAVGERLALAARRVAYGECSLLSSGPELAGIERDGNALVLGFSAAGAGLAAHGPSLGGFAVAGKDGQFHWATATISGANTVRVVADGVNEPQVLRYAWADNPTHANLYNSVGLPASPFTANVRD